jgi:hypothetical protein
MITPKRLLALTTKWLLISVFTLFCALYASDELAFQYKVHSSQSGSAFGAVDMQRMLAIELKGGKVQYTLDQQQPAQIQKCVYSLFPHAGFSPCWYLLRQSRKPIPLVIVSGFRGECVPQKLEQDQRGGKGAVLISRSAASSTCSTLTESIASE